MLEQFCSFLQEQGKSENTVKFHRLPTEGYMKWYEATFSEPVRQLYGKTPSETSVSDFRSSMSHNKMKQQR